MELLLRPAEDKELAFCESLNRGNMSRYLADRAIAWDPDRFLRSWADFENFIIELDGQDIGLLRLTPEQHGLGLRDLQILLFLPCHIIDDMTLMHHDQTVAVLDGVFHVVGDHHGGQVVFLHDPG